MSNVKFCPTCGMAREEAQCGCGHDYDTFDSAKLAFDSAYAGATMQAQMFATVMQGMMGVHAVGLMEQFWNGLNEASRKHFAQKLLERILQLLSKGAADGAIVKFLSARSPTWTGETLVDDDGALVPHVRRAYIARAAQIIRGKEPKEHYGKTSYFSSKAESAKHAFHYELREAISEGVKDAVRAAVKDVVTIREESLLSLVRDRMPDIDKLAEDAIREMTQEAVENVKNKVRGD